MSDLSTGTPPDFPANWGYPASVYNYCTGRYETGGMIWWGEEPATVADIVAIASDPRYNGHIDIRTLCGTSNPKWTTFREEILKENPGGCYKQHLKL